MLGFRLVNENYQLVSTEKSLFDSALARKIFNF